MTAIAPGKIILTGEHAVVYGKPALVTAVNRFARTCVESDGSSSIRFAFRAGKQSSEVEYTADGVFELYCRLNDRYQEFSAEARDIGSVLTNPLELIPYAYAVIANRNNAAAGIGVRVTVDVDIPPGCGMGASAAVSLSVLKSVAEFYNVELGMGDYYECALRCERLQHGRPSGIDPYVCLHGGFIRFQTDAIKRLAAPRTAFSIVLTGTPESSTGECVMKVRENHAGTDIWTEFEAVALELELAIAADDITGIYRNIRENHRLLTMIGVVPKKVCEFVREVEDRNGAAKISGGGSVKGDRAGVVIVFADFELAELCEKFDYTLLSISGENRGLRSN